MGVHVLECVGFLHTSIHTVWVHTCARGLAPSSLKLNGRQPAVKLDCLSLCVALSLLRWKEGEWSGPKALIVEAHFEAFNVWHTLTHCQKHNDLQTATLSIKQVWQSYSIRPNSSSEFLSKRHFLAESQQLAAQIPVSHFIWLTNSVGTIPFVTEIRWFEWGFSKIIESAADSPHSVRLVCYVSEPISRRMM